MWKTCQKVLEKSKDLSGVQFIELKPAVERLAVVVRKFEIETVKVGNAGVHSADHLVLEIEKSRVLERDPYVAGEG